MWGRGRGTSPSPVRCPPGSGSVPKHSPHGPGARVSGPSLSSSGDQGPGGTGARGVQAVSAIRRVREGRLISCSDLGCWTRPRVPRESFQSRDHPPPSPREGLEENSPQTPPPAAPLFAGVREREPEGVCGLPHRTYKHRFPGLPPPTACCPPGGLLARGPDQGTDEGFHRISRVAQERPQEGPAARGRALTETARSSWARTPGAAWPWGRTGPQEDRGEADAQPLAARQTNETVSTATPGAGGHVGPRSLPPRASPAPARSTHRRFLTGPPGHALSASDCLSPRQGS